MTIGASMRAGLGVLACGLAFATAGALPARAGVITDAANDFLPTFAGAHDPSLDVLSLAASFDGTQFHIAATEAGDIAAFPNGIFVIGFNRGAGVSNFAAIGAPGVVFDAVITLTSAGVTGGRDLVANAPIVLPAGAALISGNSFEINIPLALLPSEGLAPAAYGVNLWPRDGAVPAGNTQIADFAPDNSLLGVLGPVLGVPEPVSAALFMSGILGLGIARRRRLGRS